jgi:hypothetical protein
MGTPEREGRARLEVVQVPRLDRGSAAENIKSYAQGLMALSEARMARVADERLSV